MKKIQPFKWFIYAAVFLSVLSVVIFFALSKIDVNYTYQYIDNVIVKNSWQDNFQLATYIYSGIIVMFLIAAIVNIFSEYKKGKTKLWLNLIVSVIFIPLMVGIVVFGSTLVTGWDAGMQTEYYEYEYKGKTLVITEEYREGECRSEIFQIMEDDKAVKLGGFFTDNGHRNNGKYSFKEQLEGASIYFEYDDKGLKGHVDIKWQ